jgi:hypothetical protein
MTKGILPWSYSSLTAFETCPRRFKLTRITKEVVEAQTEATLHGNEVHKALENHLNGDKHLPDKYADYLPLVERVKATPGKRLVEYKFALTQSFKPTTFFAKDAWVRGVIDVGVVQPTHAIVLDWKTGKPKDDHDQLKLFAATAFATHPFVETVKTGYVWLAHNKIDSKEFTKDDVAGIWQEFLPRVTRLTKAAEKDNFPPKPSGLCTKWCPVTKDQCEFSGRIK